MARTSLLAFLVLLTAACGGARISHDEIRRQIAEMGGAALGSKAVSIRRVVSQSGNRAIAETNVELAVQLERSGPDQPWQIAAVRLGDQNWIGMDELVSAVNAARARETQTALEKLAAGIAAFRRLNNGASPSAGDIVTLTDVLHPLYMTDLVRLDAWGRPIEFIPARAGVAYSLRSMGPDGVPGSDDILLEERVR
jgi:hypothetical protein